MREVTDVRPRSPDGLFPHRSFGSSPSCCENQEKQVLPDYVLKVQTVAVAIQPYAGEPLTNPTANRTAEDNVERALTQWGRFRLVSDAQFADLVIAVRTGHAGGQTVNNSPTDNRPLIIQQGGGNTRVGA